MQNHIDDNRYYEARVYAAYQATMNAAGTKILKFRYLTACVHLALNYRPGA